MTERLLLPRIEPKDGVLDFRELGRREKDSDGASADNWNLGFANVQRQGSLGNSRSAARLVDASMWVQWRLIASLSWPMMSIATTAGTRA